MDDQVPGPSSGSWTWTNPKPLRSYPFWEPGLGDPAWSADGTSLAHVAGDPDRYRQLFVHEMEGEGSQQITRIRTGVRNFRPPALWSKFGKDTYRLAIR